MARWRTSSRSMPAAASAGKPIELVTLDDVNDRKAAGANTQKLLTANNAVALFRLRIGHAQPGRDAAG
jgi:ABC-type branched-subunit amino acid transport system substrate-binding protein